MNPIPRSLPALVTVLAAVVIAAVMTFDGDGATTATSGVVAGPAPAALATCRPLTQSRLYFGLDTPDGTISDGAWDAFVDQAVTPRFPQGLTLLDAQGRWRDAQGAAAGQRSRVVELVHADSAADRRALSEVIHDYKARFRQDGVLLTQAPVRACA